MDVLVRWVRRGAVLIVGAATIGTALLLFAEFMPGSSGTAPLALGALALLPGACALAWWFDRRSVTSPR